MIVNQVKNQQTMKLKKINAKYKSGNTKSSNLRTE